MVEPRVILSTLTPAALGALTDRIERTHPREPIVRG